MHLHRYGRAVDGERNVNHGIGARSQGDGLGEFCKSWGLDGQIVDAKGRFRQRELAVVSGVGVERRTRSRLLKHDLRAGHGAVLGIVNDASDRGKDGGAGGQSCKQGQDQEQCDKTAHKQDLTGKRSGRAESEGFGHEDEIQEQGISGVLWVSRSKEVHDLRRCAAWRGGTGSPEEKGRAVAVALR